MRRRRLPTRSVIAALLSSSELATIMGSSRSGNRMLPGCPGSVNAITETLDEDFDLRIRHRIAADAGGRHGSARMGVSTGRRDRSSTTSGNRRTQARAGQPEDLYPVAD